MVFSRAASMRFLRRQQGFDPLPLLVAHFSSADGSNGWDSHRNQSVVTLLLFCQRVLKHALVSSGRYPVRQHFVDILQQVFLIQTHIVVFDVVLEKILDSSFDPF